MLNANAATTTTETTMTTAITTTTATTTTSATKTTTATIAPVDETEMKLGDYALKQGLSLPTQQAHKYLKRLSKHFQHKVDVQFSHALALITFEEGQCKMQATTEALSLVCCAQNRQDLLDITDTMDRHMLAFSRDDVFEMVWCDIAIES